MRIQLVDLKRQYQSLKKEIDQAALGVLDSGSYILGENVTKLEEEIAAYCGVKYAVGVASGTDALQLSLMALGIKAGDEVITTPFTFIATAEAICKVGARPVFADIDINTYNIDPKEIEKKITKNTKAIIPVHLYGQPCRMDEIMKIAEVNKLKVVEDCCQAIGAEYKGKKVGSFGDTGCFSFFPSKNLSAFGDGGMVVTNNGDIYEILKVIRVHGSKNKYFHIRPGLNSRLDEFHAAILRVKLPRLDKWNNARRKNAKIYNEYFKRAKLADNVICPKEDKDIKHIYNIYAIRAKNRDTLKDYLAQAGIQTGVHYPLGLHFQEVYKRLAYQMGDFPVTEAVSSGILSLPMHPHLEKAEIELIVKTISAFYAEKTNRKALKSAQQG